MQSKLLEQAFLRNRTELRDVFYYIELTAYEKEFETKGLIS